MNIGSDDLIHQSTIDNYWGWSHWSYFQITGCQPARLFQTRYARFWMLKNVNNQFKILNTCIQTLK